MIEGITPTRDGKQLSFNPNFTETAGSRGYQQLKSPG
jgi:hypothetical protein